MQAAANKTERAAAEDWESLIASVCADNEAAWTRFGNRLSPLTAAIARKRSRHLDADAHRDVYVRVLTRLSQRDCRALRKFLETRSRYRNLTFDSYLAAVVASCLIDHLRARPESSRRREHAARKLVSVQLSPLGPADEPRTADGATSDRLEKRIAARRLITALSDARFPVGQRRAMLLWLHGYAGAEIADEMQLTSAAEASRLIRAARARLRRQVGRDQ